MDLNNLFQILLANTEQIETPCFVFNLKTIEHNIQKFRDALKPDKLFFGVRCNPLVKVLKCLRDNQCGFDISNMAEWANLQDLADGREETLNGSPITPSKDLGELFKKGIRYFTADSYCQIESIVKKAPGAKTFIRIASSDAGSGIRESHRLGADDGYVANLIKFAIQKGLDICGLCFHPGSQCSNLENWKAGISCCARLVRDFPRLKILYIGGGFPVSYLSPVSDLKTVASTIRQAINNYYPFNPVLWAQPSRFLVANAAVTLASALHVDDMNYPRRVFVDASVLAGHGELLTQRDILQYPVCSLSPGNNFYRYSVYGCTNSGVDTFSENALLSAVQVDHDVPARSSRIVLAKTGAYCPNLAADVRFCTFNGAKVPKVYFVENGQLALS